MEKIAVIGLGYVGLPLAVVIDQTSKYQTIGFDINKEHITKLKNSRNEIEPDLNEYLKTCSIDFTSDPSDLADIDCYVVCVPTPVKNKYEPNLEPLKNSLELISQYLQPMNTVIIESTINPGVCDEIAIPYLEEASGLKVGVDFDLAHCPERINPGDKKWTVYNIPRNIGANSPAATKRVADFYRSFINAEIKEVSSLQVAEATKILENTFRDINIAYVNELSKSFDLLGIDLVETINAASSKPFSFMAHYPGCGVGGHCIPVDPYYLIAKAQSIGFEHKFLKMAREVNHSMPKFTVAKTIKALNRLGMPVNGTNILLYGLSYKANVGDLRESPALEIKSELDQWHANLNVYDPFMQSHSNVSSLEQIHDSVQLIIIATSHDQIVDYDFSKFTSLKIVVDGRNCIDPDKLPEGVNYHGIGRKKLSTKDIEAHTEKHDSEGLVQDELMIIER